MKIKKFKKLIKNIIKEQTQGLDTKLPNKPGYAGPPALGGPDTIDKLDPPKDPSPYANTPWNWGTQAVWEVVEIDDTPLSVLNGPTNFKDEGTC